MAVTSLTCGLLGLLGCPALLLLPRALEHVALGLLLIAPSGLGVAGLVTGIVALHRIRRVTPDAQGPGVAIAGCITSVLTLLAWVLF